MRLSIDNSSAGDRYRIGKPILASDIVELDRIFSGEGASIARFETNCGVRHADSRIISVERVDTTNALPLRTIRASVPKVMDIDLKVRW